jgi:hypothetical protein
VTKEPIQHPTGTPPASDTAAGRTARRHRVALLRDIQLFAGAVAAPARDPDWRCRLDERLAALHGSFAGHRRMTEGPDGLYTELLDHAPRLARQVHGLIREHAALTATVCTLQRRVDRPECSVEELRGQASDLLRELSRHRQRGADLVYEAYATDIGGET